MKYLVLMSILIAGSAFGETLTDPSGRTILRQNYEGGRLVDRAPNGTMLGTWTREGGALVHRAPNGALLGRVR